MLESVAKTSMPFVGRETELCQLHEALDSVANTKKPKFVLIQGDYGVGKTALVRHFLVQVSAQNPSFLIGKAKCAMETELNGLVPFTQLFKDLTEQGTQRRVVLGSLFEFIKEVAPAWLDVFTAGAATATIKTVEESSKLMRRGTFLQDNVFVQFTNALSRLAEKQPIIAFIDDLHWADSSSLGLLFHLARHLQDRAVLFVCTYRPVEALETSINAPLFRKLRANLIRYGATDLEIHQGIDVAEYVAQRYPLNIFSSDLINHIQGLTGGHPLFVSELFSLWQDNGALTFTPTDDGHEVWVLTQDADVYPTIPHALTEVLEERVQLLEDELRKILTCASVEGEEFTAQVIAYVCQLDESRVYDNLETLEHRYQLVQEQGPREVNATLLDFYRFVHRFFCDHIYNQLGSGKRRILHRRIAECLEVLYSGRHQIAGQLAQHFREAYELMKSVQYALMAAQFEQSRYAWSEGEAWCEFGLALVDKLPVGAETIRLRLDLLERSGDGYNCSGKCSQAGRRYREALILAQQLKENAERIPDLYWKIAWVCEGEGRFEESAAFLDQSRQFQADHAVPDGETHFRTESLWAFIQLRLGKSDLAVQVLQKVLVEVERLPQTPMLELVRAQVYNWLGIALSFQSCYAESSAAYQKAIEIASRLGERATVATILANLSDNQRIEGKLDECEVSISRAMEIARQIGDTDTEAYTLYLRGVLLLDRERPREAIQELKRAIALSDQIGTQWNDMRANLALAYLAESDLESAYEQASLSLAATEKGQVFDQGYAHYAMAQIEGVRQDWESAAQHFSQAINIFHQVGDRHYAARAQRYFAEELLRQGKRREAVELLQAALATFQELRLAHAITETQRLLDVSAT